MRCVGLYPLCKEERVLSWTTMSPPRQPSASFGAFQKMILRNRVFTNDQVQPCSVALSLLLYGFLRGCFVLRYFTQCNRLLLLCGQPDRFVKSIGQRERITWYLGVPNFLTENGLDGRHTIETRRGLRITDVPGNGKCHNAAGQAAGSGKPTYIHIREVLRYIGN